MTQAEDPIEVVEVPGVLGGTPVLRGTRIPAETIRQYLLQGRGKSEIYADYPYLPVGAVEAVQRWAERGGLRCIGS